MTGNSKPNLKAMNAIRTYILNPVSAFSKNSLKRSTAGSASVGTATTVPDRPATANTETPTRVQPCRSKRLAGFKHDTQFTRVRLSKGRNLKEHRSDFILCEYPNSPGY